MDALKCLLYGIVLMAVYGKFNIGCFLFWAESRHEILYIYTEPFTGYWGFRTKSCNPENYDITLYHFLASSCWYMRNQWKLLQNSSNNVFPLPSATISITWNQQQSAIAECATVVVTFILFTESDQWSNTCRYPVWRRVLKRTRIQ